MATNEQVLKAEKIVKIAQATPFRYDDVKAVYDMWEDDEVVECVLHSSMMLQQSPYYMMDVFEQQFRSIDRTNYRAIAELQVLLLMRGWY